jgi:phosphoglycolate phosphatase-like HAD superfamily hydrolase
MRSADGHEIRAMLFDFDGTLADSYAAITASVNNVWAMHGLSPLEESGVRRHVGRGLEHLLKSTLPDIDLGPDSESYRSHHPTVMLRGTRLLPSAHEVLVAGKKAGLLVGVCSNKPRGISLPVR